MRIREVREASGVSCTELSRRCGVTRTSEWQWEVGKAFPTADKLPLIAATLGCEVNDLFDPEELRAASEAAAARVREKAAADAKAMMEEGEECRA